MNLIDLSDEDGRRAVHAEEGDWEPETDEERLEKLKKIRDTLRQVRDTLFSASDMKSMTIYVSNEELFEKMTGMM